MPECTSNDRAASASVARAKGWSIGQAVRARAAVERVTADYPTARIQDGPLGVGHHRPIRHLHGLVIGLFFSWAMVKALPDQAMLMVPIGQLAAGTLLAALAGMVAAILPARRAARLDILAAISTD